MTAVGSFKAVLDDRDAETTSKDSYGYINKGVPALDLLYRGERPVKFFDGSIATKVDTVNSFRADYSGEEAAPDPDWGWGSYADGESFIVEWISGKFGTLYFKVTGYFDSWDNGDDDVFKATDIVEVNKIPVNKFTWEEVA